MSNYDTDYHACIDVASRIATMPTDGEGNEGGTIDDQTREAARAFLRSEFGAWTGAQRGDEPESEETQE